MLYEVITIVVPSPPSSGQCCDPSQLFPQHEIERFLSQIISTDKVLKLSTEPAPPIDAIPIPIIAHPHVNTGGPFPAFPAVAVPYGTLFEATGLFRNNFV